MQCLQAAATPTLIIGTPWTDTSVAVIYWRDQGGSKVVVPHGKVTWFRDF